MNHAEYMRGWRKKHPDSNKLALRKWRKKNPHQSFYYHQTFNGYFSNVLGRIRWRCKTIERYKGLPFPTKSEWDHFLVDTKMIRRRLFNKWLKSDRQHRLAPSIDRIDSKYGYVVGNMRWIPFWVNCREGGRAPHVVRGGDMLRDTKGRFCVVGEK